MPFLALIGGWRNVALAAAAVVALLYVGALKWTIAGLERDVAELTADLETANRNVEIAAGVNAENLVTVEKLRTDSVAVRTAVAGALQAAERRCAESVRIKREVARVVSESPAQCPVAPSIRAALRELQPDAGSADRDEDRPRGGGAAGGAARLPR